MPRAKPFAGRRRTAKTIYGRITYPGFEPLQWAVDVTVNCSTETPALVEFHLEATGSGTTRR